MIGIWINQKPNLKAYRAGLEAAMGAHSEGLNGSDFEVVTLQAKLANPHYVDWHLNPGIKTPVSIPDRYWKIETGLRPWPNSTLRPRSRLRSPRPQSKPLRSSPEQRQLQELELRQQEVK